MFSLFSLRFFVVVEDKVLDELSRDEIAAAFERGTYGILHCVRLEKGKLTDLKTFLSDKNFEEAEKETSAEEREKSFTQMMEVALGAVEG